MANITVSIIKGHKVRIATAEEYAVQLKDQGLDVVYNPTGSHAVVGTLVKQFDNNRFHFGNLATNPQPANLTGEAEYERQQRLLGMPPEFTRQLMGDLQVYYLVEAA